MKGHDERTGYTITNEEAFDKPDEEFDREEQTLGAPDILAIQVIKSFMQNIYPHCGKSTFSRTVYF